jgi:hypothetical protein
LCDIAKLVLVWKVLIVTVQRALVSLDMLGSLGGEGPRSTLQWKSKADSSSKGEKSFIYRGEKGKAT